MQPFTAALLTAAIGWAVLPVSGQAAKPASERDKEIFAQLYRSKLQAVQRTRTIRDDQELYEDMLDFASEIPDDPGVRGLIYSEVIPMAISTGDIQTMIHASNKMAQIWPDHPLTQSKALIDLADRAYRTASRSNRGAIAGPLIDLLLKGAKEYADTGDYKQALDLSRQAITIAKAVNSDKTQKVKGVLDTYLQESETLNRIKMLTLSVRKNPQNRPAAKELVDLLIIKRNDPTAAMEFAALAGDDELQELITLCDQGVDEATAATAMRVGDWYAGLAQQEDDAEALQLLIAAQVWYQRFFDEYTRRDTLAARVQQMNDAVKNRIDKISPPVAVDEDAGWVNLFDDPFDTDKHLIDSEEKFEVTAQGLKLLPSANLAVPFPNKEPFELRVVTTLNEQINGGEDVLAMYVPVEDEAFSFHLFAGNERLGNIHGVQATHSEEIPKERLNAQMELVIQAAMLKEDVLAVHVLLNGKSAMKWRGSLEGLIIADRVNPDEDLGRVLYFNCTSVSTIHKLEYRKLNGDALLE